MTKLEEQVLNFFCILEISLGFWMISSPLGNADVIHVVELYSPLWLLGVIFVLGGFSKLLSKKNYLWAYILLVSVPLTFFGLLSAQIVLTTNVLNSYVIVFNLIGIYSAVYAGQVYKKKVSGVIETITIEKTGDNVVSVIKENGLR